MDGPPFLEVWRCSVVVMNFINYPEVASEVPARDLALWLHSLYCKLDAVAKQHEAHKVSTAHELYMCVLQEQDGFNTAAAAVSLAKQLLEAVQELTLPSGSPLCCRIAVSTGKAAAAVTGTAAWSFQLYGKTLEKARAVVQAGPVGVLQLTNDVVSNLPNSSDFERHRLQPEFGGLEVFVQSDGGRFHRCHQLAAALQLVGVSTTTALTSIRTRLRTATNSLHFQDPTLENCFRHTWNTKLYHQDLWTFAILVPLSLVACLTLPATTQYPLQKVLAMALLWALTGLTVSMVVVWSYRPVMYVKYRTLFISLYRMVRMITYFLLRTLVSPPSFTGRFVGFQTLIPHGLLVFSALAISIQVPFELQVGLHLLAYVTTMADAFGACKQQGVRTMMLQCTVVGSLFSAWLNFVAGVMIPLVLSSALERSARLAFLRRSKAVFHKVA